MEVGAHPKTWEYHTLSLPSVNSFKILKQLSDVYLVQRNRRKVIKISRENMVWSSKLDNSVLVST